MLSIKTTIEDQFTTEFCLEFINSSKPKYILGTNDWAVSVAEKIKVDGFIDDYSSADVFMDTPIIKSTKLEDDALVLVTSVYRPKTAMKRAKELSPNVLDYFSFYKYSGMELKQVLYWDGFLEDFERNRAKYNYIYGLLSDTESKEQFQNILSFRVNYDIEAMSSFECDEQNQYFEDFLNLSRNGEIFVDVGGFDGFTTQEFIKRCPNYKGVHIFEPEAANLEKARNNLRTFPSIEFHPYGLYNKKTSFRFATGGSASRISDEGEIEIKVDTLDNVIDEPVTFIKMDIEGAEVEAIKGAENIIKKHKPRLAISAYHKPNDFWKIPETVLAIRDDYKVYLRHYMEGVTETVLFFV